MKNLALCALAAVSIGYSATGLAADFDGTKPLICATVDARDCVRGQDCFRGLAEAIGAPQFFRVDFAQKSIQGPNRTTPITVMEITEGQVLLQGKELGFAWVVALDQSSGRFSGTLTNAGGAFVLFGNCTPL